MWSLRLIAGALFLVANALFLPIVCGQEDEPVLAKIVDVPTYRQLILPLNQKLLRERLGFDTEQTRVLKEFVRENVVVMPAFDGLQGDSEQIAGYFERLEKRIKAVDKRYFDLWEEVLLPQQSDTLLGIWIIDNGLNALSHPAVAKRLDFSDLQSEKLQDIIAKNQKQRRATWADLGTLLDRSDINSEQLSQLLSLRMHQHLRIAKPILSNEQFETLSTILRLVPRKTAKRFSLGL